jgi:hypothetical protein
MFFNIMHPSSLVGKKVTKTQREGSLVTCYRMKIKYITGKTDCTTSKYNVRVIFITKLKKYLWHMSTSALSF